MAKNTPLKFLISQITKSPIDKLWIYDIITSKIEKEKVMKNYCLKDIYWIYAKDGSFVTPFIINRDDTKIKDLANDEVIELPDMARTTFDIIASMYAEMLQINEDDLDIKQLTRLMYEEIVTLKSIKNLKFTKLKHDLLKSGYSECYGTFIVNEEDIQKITREIVSHFRPQNKREHQAEKISKQTRTF